jgi:hypothetical protein
MIRGVAFSKWRVAAFAAGIGSASTAALLYHRDGINRSERLAEIAGQQSDLVAKIAVKSSFEQSALDALRNKVNRFRLDLGPEGSWDRAVRLLGKAWAANAGTRDEREGYSVQKGSFSLQSPATNDWPQIIEAVKSLGQIPGVCIIGFEMKTGGDRVRRSVDLVKIVVAVQTLRSTPNPVIK